MLDESWDAETVVVKSNDDDTDKGSEVDRSGDTDPVDSDVSWRMLEEFCNIESGEKAPDEDEDTDCLEEKSNDDDNNRGSDVDRSGDTDSADTDVSWRMLEEICTVESVEKAPDEDEDTDWLEDKSNDDDNDRGSEVDRSVDTDSIDTDVDWKMLKRSCDVETGVVDADKYENNNWLDNKSNDDDDERKSDLDRSGDSDTVETDICWEMLEESWNVETVEVVAEVDEDNEWLDVKSNDDDDDDESGNEVDRSKDMFDSVDTDAGSWTMEGSCEVDTVLIDADDDEGIDWVEGKSNDDADRRSEGDRPGDTDSIESDVGWSILDESYNGETVEVVADGDDANDWLEEK